METEILEQPDVQEEKKEKFKSFSDKFKKHFNIFQLSCICFQPFYFYQRLFGW